MAWGQKIPIYKKTLFFIDTHVVALQHTQKSGYSKYAIVAGHEVSCKIFMFQPVCHIKTADCLFTF